ncbi:hypothetical protein IQ07DRAFT_57615 [Pyrenochaeta sp. DS3sAY3a]|nr:hypothetical protein IQ07DRAFT_57615 [Pyrenochaeta sp. DS3sAY3a]
MPHDTAGPASTATSKLDSKPIRPGASAILEHPAVPQSRHANQVPAQNTAKMNPSGPPQTVNPVTTSSVIIITLPQRNGQEEIITLVPTNAPTPDSEEETKISATRELGLPEGLPRSVSNILPALSNIPEQAFSPRPAPAFTDKPDIALSNIPNPATITSPVAFIIGTQTLLPGSTMTLTIPTTALPNDPNTPPSQHTIFLDPSQNLLVIDNTIAIPLAHPNAPISVLSPGSTLLVGGQTYTLNAQGQLVAGSTTLQRGASTVLGGTAYIVDGSAVTLFATTVSVGGDGSRAVVDGSTMLVVLGRETRVESTQRWIRTLAEPGRDEKGSFRAGVEWKPENTGVATGVANEGAEVWRGLGVVVGSFVFVVLVGIGVFG